MSPASAPELTGQCLENPVPRSPPLSLIYFPLGWINTFPKMTAGVSGSQQELLLPPLLEPLLLPEQRLKMTSAGWKAPQRPLSPSNAGMQEAQVPAEILLQG